MPETEAPETIRSALAYFQRGGLVEMTERTLAEMAAGRTVVECDADGVLALCSLAAEAMVARAGRGEGDDALVEAMCETYDAATDDEAIDEAMARVLALVRRRDSVHLGILSEALAALTASLAEAEARAQAMHRRAQTAEGALEKANEMLALAGDNGGRSSRNTVRYYRKWQEAEARAGRAEADFSEAVAEVDLRGVVITRLVELLKIMRPYMLPDVEETPAMLKITARVEEIEAEIAPFFAALQETPHGR